MRAARIAVALAGLALAACGKHEAQPARAAQPDPWQGSASTGPLETLGDPPPAITVLAPGAAPQRVLAYAPHGSARHPSLALTMAPAGAPADVATRVRVTLHWQAPRDLGAPWQVAIDKVDAPPAQGAGSDEQAVIDAIWATLRLFRGQIDVASAQHIRLMRTGGPVSSPSMLDVLYSVIVPFPSQAIGVGARWEVRQTLHEANGEAAVDRVFELVSLDGDRADVRVTGQARWTSPGGAATARMDESITGTLALRLDDVLPVTADVTRAMTTHMTDPGSPGRVVDLRSTLHVQVGT